MEQQTAVACPSAPKFLQEMREAIDCGRNIQIITGDIGGLFWASTQTGYRSLEQTLFAELSDQYTVLALDMVGLCFYDNDSLEAIIQVHQQSRQEQPRVGGKRISLESLTGSERLPDSREDLVKKIAESKYSPLTAMAVLREIFRSYAKARRQHQKPKPLCVVVRYAAALFPEKELGMLDQQDRQRLVYFLNWLLDPEFFAGEDVFLLVENSKAEINQKISNLTNCEHIQIPLPDANARRSFLQEGMRGWNVAELLEMGVPEFVEVTAGLPLARLQDLIQTAGTKHAKVAKKDVVQAVNALLHDMLGNIVTFKPVDHTVADVDGYDATKTLIREVFEDCDDPVTAVSGILVSGPNGSGKTWIIEACAADSGRVVIELSGLRVSDFGGTERFFEQFRLVAQTFGRILVEIDEAHTAFGSVHNTQTHEVEKRLAGNLIKMMGDPQNFGKILWVLMTSRPDELDPDVKSRCPIQIPVFDLEGDERKAFVVKQFAKKKLQLGDEDLAAVLERIKTYSNRDISFLLKTFLARQRRKTELTVVKFLDVWQASGAIQQHRQFQELVAVEHCSFSELVPKRLKTLTPEQRSQKISDLKWSLQI